MTKLYLAIVCTFLLSAGFAQKLAQVTIDNRSNAAIISFLVDETVVLNINKDGNIIDWGIEYNTVRTSIYPAKLLKYMGREEYYSSTDNEAYRGKIKYIGRTLITYYSSYENEEFRGKVKNIGPNLFDYYPSYDDKAFKGNIKNAGSVSISYYSSFDDETYRGKIKAVGNISLTYYGLMDDKAYRGKVKNIDRSLFTYYSSYDRPGYAGILKKGSPILYSGGIKYYIKN